MVYMDTHKAWIKPSASTIELFNNVTDLGADVTRRKMFGSPTAFINGNMFAWIHEDKITLRLPQEIRKDLLQKKHGEPVDPTGKRMREYLMIADEVSADEELVRKFVQAAFDYVSALPPKHK